MLVAQMDDSDLPGPASGCGLYHEVRLGGEDARCLYFKIMDACCRNASGQVP
jgi:hypothetical protein